VYSSSCPALLILFDPEHKYLLCSRLARLYENRYKSSTRQRKSNRAQQTTSQVVRLSNRDHTVTQGGEQLLLINEYSTRDNITACVTFEAGGG